MNNILMSRGKIAPSLMAADPLHWAREIEAVGEAGADSLHLDVMDGHYVPNLTFGPDHAAAVRRHTMLPLDAHLMVTDADFWVPLFIKAGADGILFHPDGSQDPARLLRSIAAQGRQAGIALKPGESPEGAADLLPLCAKVLVMTVMPGFCGQSFMAQPLQMIRRIKDSYPDIEVTVDGGINAHTAPAAWEARADVLVAGNGVFKNPPYAQAIAALRKPEEREGT